MPKLTVIILFIMLFYLPVTDGLAQYFGKNKPSYRTFDFELSQTPHFNIYHYLEDSSRVKFIGNLAEQWYHYHRQILVDTFTNRNPIIFYRNHPDFQQTTAIMSTIGVGTGGVTEGLKRRVVMPFSFSDYQTSHVLGHELVHAFQYHIIEESEKLNLGAISKIPLWMVEGMAEYLSVGNIDAFTAVWMRDALLHDDFPTLENMGRGHYSPYRFGQAFWSFIASRYGEQYIRRLFSASASQGFYYATEDVLGITVDSLSSEWRKTLTRQLLSPGDSTYTIIGERLLSKKNSGRYNLSPSVSRDGKHLIFLSERDVYSLDLFLADAQTGKVIDKIYTSTRNSEIDALEFTETAGTWSPDSRYFAYVAYQKGKTVILIHDVEKNKLHKTIASGAVDALSSPSWAPDGKGMVFSGMNHGISNLYYIDLATGSVSQLTINQYACMQPVWTRDGKHIWYITDEATPGQAIFFPGNFNLARYDINASTHRVFKTFPGARNLNPMPLAGSPHVFFLSNVNGRRDLYSLNTETGQLKRATEYGTGIMGMTEMSPALSIGGNTLYYSMLRNGEFQIIKAPAFQLLESAKPVSHQPFDYRAARLTPYSEHFSVVDQNLIFRGLINEDKDVELEAAEPRNQFKLDYIGNMAAGVMTGRFGTGMAGSIEALFSDVLGHHLLYGGASINGRIYDFGGQVALLNQKRRIKLGLSLSHIPYRIGYYTYEENGAEEELVYYSRRIFEDKASVFSFLPLDRYNRVEAGLSMAHYNYRYEKIEDIENYYPTYHNSGKKIDAPEGFWVGRSDVAYVFDNSRFGIASPVDGTRARFQFEQFYNGVDAHAILFDYRKYHFVRPFSVAFRLYHYGRYGSDRDTNRLTRLFAGYPWLVRGYDTGNFYSDSTQNSQNIGIKHLIGSSIVVSNLEWRMPLSGPIDIALLNSSFIFSEMVLFLDAGLAWDKDSRPVLSLTTNSDARRIPVFSTGMSIRFSLLGVMVIEPYWAFPIHQNRIFNGQFGFNVFPGW